MRALAYIESPYHYRYLIGSGASLELALHKFA